MSKYAVSKRAIQAAETEAQDAKMDRHEVIEALLTTCIQDMKEHRGADYTRTYLSYELDCVGTDDLFDIQKR